jgi:methylenetetrahydrofolate reductase (NADPH)
VSAPGFEVVCEIQPSTRPDLMRVRHQIGAMSKVASAFLVPDNHLGRATVSSVAVAHEVDRMGGRSVACLNARDRNLLGLRRDLLTAAAYGVGEFLLVYGDRPTAGARSGELTVRSMMGEVRHFSAFEEAGIRPKVAVTSRLSPLPGWKAEADLLFVQASYRPAVLAAWRDGVDFAGKVYAGVLVPPSGARARKWSAEISEIDVPEEWIAAVDRDPMAGVELACELVGEIADLGGFDGVHLIPGVRYREVAARLEPLRAQLGAGSGGAADG